MRFLRGDPVASEQVARRVRRVLRYRALEMPKADLDDLEQQVMTELWQAVNRRTFDFAAGFWGFVELITVRRTIDWLRTKRRSTSPRSESAVHNEVETPYDVVVRRERIELAQRILADLGSHCRQVIELRLRDRMSFREIGQVLGIREGAARVRMHRCIRSAREVAEKLRLGQAGRSNFLEGSDESFS